MIKKYYESLHLISSVQQAWRNERDPKSYSKFDTIKNIINRFENDHTTNNMKGRSGRKKTVVNEHNIKRVRQFLSKEKKAGRRLNQESVFSASDQSGITYAHLNKSHWSVGLFER